MRTRFVIAAMLMLAWAPVKAGEIPKLVKTEVTVGEIAFLKLPGNPKAGYKWRFNREQSSGLDLVEVNIVGWLMARKDVSMLFNNEEDRLNVALKGKAEGQAKLAFDYYRRFIGRIVSQTSTVQVDVKPRAASR